MNIGTPTALAGYDIYRIPLNDLDVISLKWDKSNPFSGTLGGNLVAVIEESDNTFVQVVADQSTANGYLHFVNAQATFIGYSNSVALYLNVKADRASTLSFARNKTVSQLVNDIESVKILTASNTADLPFNLQYINTNNVFATISSPFYVMKMPVKKGDKFAFVGTLTGLSFRGTMRNKNGTVTQITNAMVEYVCPNDGVMFLFGNPNLEYSITYYPADSIKISADNIVGDIGWNQFNGLDAVAFGTSLTYRAQTTYGYLQYLPDLCGMTFDNQGIGSSNILGNMLTAIKNYADYADKRVCLLEGFVNDWYGNKILGTYDDETETTVCGCVRSAINYMLSQNANLTIILVLDPYGRNYNSVDCSTTAVNGSGLTQYEFYEEIAKVGESLGIPVIKLYATSQISENTPQYIIDNIHPTKLGAKQSANAIWSGMKMYYPNEIS